MLGRARANKEITKSYSSPTGILESLLIVFKSGCMSRGYVQQCVWVQKKENESNLV